VTAVPPTAGDPWSGSVDPRLVSRLLARRPRVSRPAQRGTARLELAERLLPLPGRLARRATSLDDDAEPLLPRVTGTVVPAAAAAGDAAPAVAVPRSTARPSAFLPTGAPAAGPPAAPAGTAPAPAPAPAPRPVAAGRAGSPSGAATEGMPAGTGAPRSGSAPGSAAARPTPPARTGPPATAVPGPVLPVVGPRRVERPAGTPTAPLPQPTSTPTGRSGRAGDPPAAGPDARRQSPRPVVRPRRYRPETFRPETFRPAPPPAGPARAAVPLSGRPGSRSGSPGTVARAGSDHPAAPAPPRQLHRAGAAPEAVAGGASGATAGEGVVQRLAVTPPAPPVGAPAGAAQDTPSADELVERVLRRLGREVTVAAERRGLRSGERAGELGR
jgi:hypothetical protein